MRQKTMLNFRGRSDHIGSAAFLYRAMVTLALRWPLLALAAAEWQRTGSPCQCFPCGTNATSAQVWAGIVVGLAAEFSSYSINLCYTVRTAK